MSRRTSPQSKTDDRAFPVQIKVLTPEFSLSMLPQDPWRWLDCEIGRGEYATTGARCYVGDVMVLHLRCLEDAGRFLDALIRRCACRTKPIIWRQGSCSSRGRFASEASSVSRSAAASVSSSPAP